MRKGHPSLLDGPSLAQEGREDIRQIIRRVRMVVLSSALDCECRDRVDDAMRRLEWLEQRRDGKRLLAAAHHQRDKIAALLDLLRDFDASGIEKPDNGVLAEASLLFDDIASAAEMGSNLLREVLRLQTESVELRGHDG